MDPTQNAQSTAQTGGSVQTQDGSMPAPPQILGGTEIYDQIMGQIEPELTSTERPLLVEKYKDETPEEAKDRAERYSKALAEYEKQYQEYMTGMESKIRSFGVGVMRSVENEDKAGDTQNLTDLEKSISSL